MDRHISIFLDVCVVTLVLSLASCGQDAVETATECVQSELITQCPGGTQPVLEAAATSACDTAVSGGFVEVGGAVTGACRGAGSCRVLCQFNDPCPCGVSSLTLEGVTCNQCEGGCGDGVCDPGETPTNCAADCGERCVPGEARCQGDRIQSCTLQAIYEPARDCPVGLVCRVDGESAVCTGSATCADNLHNGSETDTDCGGGCESPCGNGKRCTSNADCESKICLAGACAAGVCGDGIIQNGEQCDDGSANSDTAVNGCRTTCQGHFCGDGVNDSDEICDDGNADGGDGCSAICLEETGFACGGQPSRCETVCGDGVAAGDEVCDDGNTVSGDYCAPDCGSVIGRCGDGQLQDNEVCDDGNTVGGDGCAGSCLSFTGECGDGDQQGGESCDDGKQCVDGTDCTDVTGCAHLSDDSCAPRDGDYCSADCSNVTGACGDGAQQSIEACDDGNNVPDDYCSNDCLTVVGFCGDDEVQANEVCDDGNNRSDDYCAFNCQQILGDCGDGVRQSIEVCDDGNNEAGDYCLPNCSGASGSCGDGLVQAIEACDDGRQCPDRAPCTSSLDCDGIGDGTCVPRSGDYCTPNCQAVSGSCGDGILQSNEACDTLQVASCSTELDPQGFAYFAGDVACRSGCAERSFAPCASHQQIVVDGGTVCRLREDGFVACWGENAEVWLRPTSAPFVALAGSDSHLCGMRPTGQLECWGRSPTEHVPDPAKLYIDARAATGYTCGLDYYGQITCWGSVVDTRPAMAGPPLNEVFKQVAVGGQTWIGDGTAPFACGVRLDGSVACWGTPPSVGPPPGMRFRQIALGTDHVCGIQDMGQSVDGGIVCWGSLPPTTIPTGTFKSITQGCGIRTDDTVACWTGTTVDTTPTDTFSQVSFGDMRACGITLSGETRCWGEFRGYPYAEPDFVSLTAGNTFTCGMTIGGAVTCWGDDTYGQVSNVPTEPFLEIDAGDDFVCGVAIVAGKPDVVCWGNNDVGQATPNTAWLIGAANFSGVTAGRAFACVSTPNMYCWGDRSLVTGGDGTHFDRESMSAGEDFICGIDDEPEIGFPPQTNPNYRNYACWGKGDYGEADPTLPVKGTGLYCVVSAGRDLACATTCFVSDVGAGDMQPYRSAGVTECWGRYDTAWTAMPYVSSTYRISTGAMHACVLSLSRDGVTCFGIDTGVVAEGDHGQVTAAPTTGAYTEVASGASHACAIASTGETNCWGLNANGQAPPP